MPVRRPSLAVALAVAFGTCAVYLAALLVTGPESRAGSVVDVWLYNALIVLAAAIATARPLLVAEDRLAWSVISLALWATAFGELYTAAVEPEGYPSLADAAWLAFYPLVYVGIVLLVRRRARFVAGTLWLDGVTASVTAAALGSAVVLEAVLRTNEGSRSAIATNLAYPVGDVLLLSAVFGVLSLAGWNVQRRWLLLALGLLATTIADAVYLFQVDTYREGGVLDVLWPLSMLLIATAAWISGRDERTLDVAGRPLLAVPVVCALGAIGIFVFDHFERVNVLALTLAAVALLLVVVRLVLTFRENAKLYALTRHESVTDSLTGLGNRRKLLTDLHRVLTDEPTPPTLLMIFDLDGFKAYNDRFGHPAGDALLARLGEKLAVVPEGRGAAYRLGGDEFCVIARVGPGEAEQLVDRAARALSEHGEAFDVTSSFGAVLLPDEATDASHALSLADERLYAQKHSRRDDTDRTMHVLLDALTTREPEFQAHVEDVAAPRGRHRAPAGPPSRRARRARPCGAAARPREARRAGRDPPQARPARRGRVGVHPAAHRRRRAHPPGLARPQGRRAARPLEPRELGRERLPGRARRRGDPARLADHPRLRRVHGDDLARPYREALHERGGARGARARLGDAVRPDRGAGRGRRRATLAARDVA